MLRLPSRAGFSVALVATALSMSLAGTGVLARLTDSASVGANTFTTAASFCATPGSSTLTATADTYVDEDIPGTNFGTSTSLKIWGDSGKLRRVLVNFTLPALPANCSVTSATLTFTRSSSVTNGNLSAYRAATSWTETGVTWSTGQPATTGIAVTVASAAVTSFTVTSQVAAMYPSSAFGFVVKASNENSNTEQVFYSRTGTTPPTLTVVIS
jgi:hypothetical protein